MIEAIKTFYKKGKSKRKNLSQKQVYKNKVRQSLFFMIALNGNYLLALVCMVLFRDGVIASTTYVKIIFFYTLLMVVLGVFYLPYKMKHYGWNLNEYKFNLGWGFLLGILGAGIAVYIRFVLVENGKREFAFNPNPEWELYIYPISVVAQETMTKGFLQNYFEHMFEKTSFNRFIAILFSSIIFGLMHLMYGFLIMYLSTLFSIILGFFFDKTKSLLGVFIIHFMIGTAMFYFKY